MVRHVCIILEHGKNASAGDRSRHIWKLIVCQWQTPFLDPSEIPVTSIYVVYIEHMVSMCRSNNMQARAPSY